MTFPEQLKAYRESNVLSQAKLAEFLAVSPRAIWQWEQGQLPHILMQEGATARMVQKKEENPLVAARFIPVPKPIQQPKKFESEAEILARLANPQLKRK